VRRLELEKAVVDVAVGSGEQRSSEELLDEHPRLLETGEHTVAAMHEHLFEHQNHLEELDLQKYATELGLDADRFERDRRSPEIARRIDQDVNSGERSGVDGTPTFYVNGIRHDGGYDLESLRPAIVTSMQRISKAR
jgi:predicted DsbA family dithiol-disulfide isomerase